MYLCILLKPVYFTLLCCPVGALENRLSILQALQYDPIYTDDVKDGERKGSCSVSCSGSGTGTGCDSDIHRNSGSDDGSSAVAAVCRVASSSSSLSSSSSPGLWLGQYDGYSDHLRDDHIEYLTRRDKDGNKHLFGGYIVCRYFLLLRKQQL